MQKIRKSATPPSVARESIRACWAGAQTVAVFTVPHRKVPHIDGGLFRANAGFREGRNLKWPAEVAADRAGGIPQNRKARTAANRRVRAGGESQSPAD
jgi:hypothetical protein